MYSSYPYAYSYATYSMPSFYSVFLTVLAALVIVAGGLALYFLFVRKPNHYQGAVARLHDALSFRTFYTEKLLRALYCIAVVSIVVSSVILLFSNFFGALLVFIAGNLIARIVFEFALLLCCAATRRRSTERWARCPGNPLHRSRRRIRCRRPSRRGHRKDLSARRQHRRLLHSRAMSLRRLLSRRVRNPRSRPSSKNQSRSAYAGRFFIPAAGNPRLLRPTARPRRSQGFAARG